MRVRLIGPSTDPWRGSTLTAVEGELQQALGRNLRRHREGLGLSQERMAQQIGIDRTYVGALERGEKNLALRSVERISALYGLHPIDLLWDRDRVVVEIDVNGAPRISDRPEAEAAAEGDPPTRPARRRRRRPSPSSD